MSDSEPPEDVSKDDLWDRVRQLEKHVYPGRRDVLKAGVGAAVGGAAVFGATGNAAAGTQSAGEVGTQSKPQDAYLEDVYDHNGNNVLSAPGDGSVSVDQQNNTLFATTWGELVNKYSSASEGQTVVLTSTTAATADSTLSITKEGVDVISTVPINPASDTRTVFEFPEGNFKFHPPKVTASIEVNSGTYSGPAVLLDPASSNFGKAPVLDLSLSNSVSGALDRSGTGVKFGAGDLGNNHISGVFGRVNVAGFATAILMEGGSTSGQYVSGNRLWGHINAAGTAIETTSNTGSAGVNEFNYQIQIDTGGGSNYGIRLGGSGIFNGAIYDKGQVATAAVAFKSGAADCFVADKNVRPIYTSDNSGGGQNLYDKARGAAFQTDTLGNVNIDPGSRTVNTTYVADGTESDLINHRGNQQIGAMTGTMNVIGRQDGVVGNRFIDEVAYDIRSGTYTVSSTDDGTQPARTYSVSSSTNNTTAITMSDASNTWHLTAQQTGGGLI